MDDIASTGGPIVSNIFLPTRVRITVSGKHLIRPARLWERCGTAASVEESDNGAFGGQTCDLALRLAW
jgi:hypothetical protein